MCVIKSKIDRMLIFLSLEILLLLGIVIDMFLEVYLDD